MARLDQHAGRGALAAMVLLIGGCTTSDPDLGFSVRGAVVAQAVDMNPQYAGVPMEGAEGVRAIAAQRRYLQGNVKKLTKIDATVDNVGATDSGGTAAVGRTSGTQ